jgi:hypothetical protein
MIFLRKQPSIKDTNKSCIKMILRSSKVTTIKFSGKGIAEIRNDPENSVLKMILRSSNSKIYKRSKVTKTVKISGRGILEVLNDPEEYLYKNSVLSQNIFIREKLKKLRRTKKNKYLYTKAFIIGSQGDIYSHLSDSCRNFVTTFFTTNLRDKTCEYCHKKSKFIERSHCHFNNGTRSELLRCVISRIWKSPNIKIPIKVLFNNFIRVHMNRPLYLLCRKCHRLYDSKCARHNYDTP